MSSEWIDVKKELPPTKGKYLIYRKGHNSGLEYLVAHYNPEVKMHSWHSPNNGKPFLITHWMPLPAPPEGSKA